ncbi:hypothetical protein WJX72_006723 [[Myrmecia] bisecta]|uniref:CRAL-TRIO domain-containing protein n=1 Tax=[Myrmecia] bisecta TaxID=41462 RepID=A0AAW1PK71_9CHLO
MTAADLQAAIQSLRARLDGTQAEALLRKGGEAGLLQQAGLDDPYLARWLRAEKNNVDRAAARLLKHAEWRAEFVPNGSIAKAEVERELASQKSFLQGTDKHGRPVIVMLAKRHLRAVRDVEETKRFICYVLDATINRMDHKLNQSGTLTSIFDLRGFGMDNYDFATLRNVFDLLQYHYPERLGMLYMYEAGVVFQGLWKLVSPFVDPVTKAKVRFVSGAAALAEFARQIDPKILPVDLGGMSELIPIDQALQRPL